MDLAKDLESSRRNMSGQTLAQDLGISQYKEISSKTGHINDVVESIMLTIGEPRRALPKDKIRTAHEVDSTKRSSMITMGSIAAAILTGAAFVMLRKI